MEEAYIKGQGVLTDNEPTAAAGTRTLQCGVIMEL